MSVSAASMPALGRTLSKMSSTKSLAKKSRDANVIEVSVGATFKDWILPIEVHPWMYAHECLRADFRDMVAALKLMIAALKSGTYCRWMASNFVLFWEKQSQFIHHHHHMEDHVIFPLLATRFTVPANLGTEHEKVAQILNGLDKLAEAIPASKNLQASYEKFLEDLVGFQEFLEPHLVEEETVQLPALLINFTREEIDKVETPAIQKFPPWMLPHYYRRLTVKEREHHMTEVLGIPVFVQKYILSGNFKKYQVIADAMEELKCPDLREPHMLAKSACCVIA